MSYKFMFKRGWFWRSRTVIGHRYEPAPLDKMVLYFADGGGEEIPEWRLCRLKLGSDFAASQKKHMEDKAGQAIPINRDIKKG